MSNGEIGYWSEPFPWSADRDPLAIPSGIKAGDIIKSDLMIRPQFMANRPEQFHPQHVWTVETGSSFQVTPPAGEVKMAPAMVINSFQMWLGTPEQWEQEHERLVLAMFAELDCVNEEVTV